MRHRHGPPPRPTSRPTPKPPGQPAAAAAIAAQLNAGMAHHNAGRLAEAEAAYRQVLATDPRQPDALHLMGVIALQVGKAAVAVELIGQAIAGNGRNAIYYSNLSSGLRRLGRLEEAIAACRQAIAIDRSFADAYNNLANAAMDLQRYGEAAEALRQLLALRPAAGDQRQLLARALILDGRPEEAVAVLEELLRREPRTSAAYVNLGVALRKLGRTAEAVAVYRRGLDIAPNDPALLSNLGTALNDGGGSSEEALTLFRRALEGQPDFVDAHVNLSVALRDLNRLDEAVAEARAAIRLKPDSAEAHTNLGHALLLQGDLPQGFAEYEWRFRMADFTSPIRNFPAPVWNGESLEGRTLLVHDEQGVGDGIHFIRYAPLLKARGARVLVECNTQLLRLLGRAPGVESVHGRFSPLPPFDLTVSLLSVPRLLGTTLDTIPADIPYLEAEPDLLERWKDRLAPDGRLRVGLVWAGSPGHRNDRNRSLTLAALAPLGRVAGVRLLSVQKGPATAQLTEILNDKTDHGLAIEDLGPEIGDFADTAAILSHLDLVVTVDTSVAHLAGALGRPVWAMLPFAPDWRWLMGREDTPWYPTMRLFRQDAPGAWEPVIERLAAALATAVADRAAG